MIQALVAMLTIPVVEVKGPFGAPLFYFLALAFIAHTPIFAHLAGVGQPLQGLNMITFFMVVSLHF
jgi:hypothetical protein